MKNKKAANHILQDLHLEYRLGKLKRSQLAKNPIDEFAAWMNEALRKRIPMPDAMALSTASKAGNPSSRVVLLKGFGPKGFIFYSHYKSPKARDLKENPRASLLFFWPQLERQIRIDGRVKKISKEESAQYFRSRPDDAKIATWISEQSKIIASRKVLEQKFSTLKQKVKNHNIALPPFWGGYCLVPVEFEFWQGREHRLNDRFRYRKRNGRWKIDQLQP